MRGYRGMSHAACHEVRYSAPMQLPAYWLPRPAPPPDAETRASFDRLLERALRRGPDHAIDYRLHAPKWQFLCHAADRMAAVMHGSGNPAIAQFEPRQPDDRLEFSNRRAVFAAADGIWPMFFAILDRARYPEMMLCNSCIRVQTTGGQPSDPYYFFSISRPALAQQPWRAGTVYILPAGSFEAQPRIAADGGSIHVAQVASARPVKPAAKLLVQPIDFPFLHQIQAHDDDRLKARIAADPDGFPWFEEP
jgi:hypothetical protein